MLTTKKTSKVEKGEMENKICGKNVLVPWNGLKMQDVPPRLYKTLIHIVLRTIMNHHKQYISGDCMKLVIHWVEDLAIYVPHLLAKKMHFALQESKMKRVKFSYPSTLQKMIDLYRPNTIEGRRFKNTCIKRSKPKKKITKKFLNHLQRTMYKYLKSLWSTIWKVWEVTPVLKTMNNLTLCSFWMNYMKEVKQM
jgi:hypothetical protein